MKNIVIVLISVLLLASCRKEDKNLTKEQIASYIIKGKKIGQETVKLLGSNLMKHMKNGGPKEAIPFCNLNASNLTNKIAKKYNVNIKRTSHKLRSNKNMPTNNEKSVLEAYLAQIERGEPLKPHIKKESDEKVHFYAPIKLQGKCLACHGSVEKEVSKSTDSIIKSLYPNDKAIGFKDGGLRGIVNITFNN